MFGFTSVMVGEAALTAMVLAPQVTIDPKENAPGSSERAVSCLTAESILTWESPLKPV
jgi:hypothetical protein